MGILREQTNKLKKDLWYKKLRRWWKFKRWLWMRKKRIISNYLK
jgi:hypothetical protein